MLAISFIWKFSVSNVKLKIIEREGLCERFERIDLSKIINTAGNHGQDFYRKRSRINIEDPHFSNKK